MSNMITYDIYEVELTLRDIPEHSIEAEGVYDMVMHNDYSTWDSVNSWSTQEQAYEVWNKILNNAVTEIREDYDGDEYLFMRVMVFEETVRDENMEPFESYELDYAVSSFEKEK